MVTSNQVKLIILLLYCAVNYPVYANFETRAVARSNPALNPAISPLAKQNRTALFERIIYTFDSKYKIHQYNNNKKDLSDNFAVYYLRQELQALIDMWRATGNIKYLDYAKDRVYKAINDAQLNQRQMIWHGQDRGAWPCFFVKEVANASGGHSQLQDFQGSAGFLMVANALKQANKTGWKEIADFVEKNIVEKWLFYAPSKETKDYHGEKSNLLILDLLDTARDKREHFATICMDLNKLGYDKYPYEQWAKLLTNLYLSIRESFEDTAPDSVKLGIYAPHDWGLIRNQSTGGYLWYLLINWKQKTLVIQDTSHANRTVWFACKAYHENHINRNILDGFVRTFKHQVWAKDKGPFYFNNYIDGRDLKAQGQGPGRKGNVWFGWHRLAAYDETLKELFISIAYDLTSGGPNIPKLTQNKTMENAPLCLLAWGARLLSSQGQIRTFP